MTTNKKTILLGVLLTALAGCASIPPGPSVAVMPAPGKPFDAFRSDDAMCKNFAHDQAGRDPDELAGEQVASGAVVGAIVGATAGSIVGDGRGGAVAGAIMGTAAGSGAAAQGRMALQRRYDVAYSQCMYARGNQVPGYAAPPYTPPPRRRRS